MIVLPCYQVTVKYLEFVHLVIWVAGSKRRDQLRLILFSRQTTRNGSKEILPNGHELVKSDQHLLLGDRCRRYHSQPVVIDMKSTQLKVSRRWKTKIAMQKVKHPKTGADGYYHRCSQPSGRLLHC